MEEINTIVRIIAVIALLAAMFIVIAAIFRFESTMSKLIVLEVAANLMVMILGLWTLHVSKVLLLDICLGLTLIVFLTTVAYCRFVAYGGYRHANTDQ